MTKRNLLLTPGPVPVPEEVREVLGAPIFHHRTPRYRKVFANISAGLKKVFMTENPVYTFAGSGSSAMEAAMINFHSSGDEVLVCEGGKFAERFTNIAKAYGLKPIVLPVEWGTAVDPALIAEALQKNPGIKSVCVQLCETSTATLSDIKAIGAITGPTETLLIVDAISGLCADRLETDNWQVDLVAGGSQKALMLPPGLGFLSVSAKARKRMDSSDLPKFYFNLKLYEKALADSDTPFTPAIGLVCGLEKVLERVEAEGLENIFARCEKLGEYTREKIKAMGLELYSKAPSATVSAAWVPEGIDGGKLVKIMRDEKGVTLAGGQGELKGKIFRISHMGSLGQEEIDEGLQVLQETLQEMGANIPQGSQ